MNSSMYPKNRAHFKKLVQFGKEILKMCKKHSVTPVLYGSAAHFILTRDKKMNVHDLDFLVPADCLPGLYNELKRKGAKEFVWIMGKTHTPDLMKAAGRAKGKMIITKFQDRDWSGIVVACGDLRVELDSMEAVYIDNVWHRKIPKDFASLDFDGIKLKMISISGLGRLYKIAYAKEKGKDKEKIRRKMVKFESYIRKS